MGLLTGLPEPSRGTWRRREASSSFWRWPGQGDCWTKVACCRRGLLEAVTWWIVCRGKNRAGKGTVRIRDRGVGVCVLFYAVLVRPLTTCSWKERIIPIRATPDGRSLSENVPSIPSTLTLAFPGKFPSAKVVITSFSPLRNWGFKGYVYVWGRRGTEWQGSGNKSLVAYFGHATGVVMTTTAYRASQLWDANIPKNC